jgi:hypothetical protein
MRDKVSEKGVRVFLMKPYDLNTLAGKVRDALGNGSVKISDEST